MIAPLDIAQSLQAIDKILQAMEQECPELINDVWNANARVEGVKTARDNVESKYINRRTAYDNGVVRLQQMGAAIGGFKGYDGFDGFDLGSYKAGKLDHKIAARPVFPEDKAQKMADEIQIWTTAATAFRDSNGAIPVETVLMALGKTEEDLAGMATQRMAAINAAQADVIPTDPMTGKPFGQ
jgi:hypothetical protein